MLNIVLFGPPGAGKGTQADRLVAHFGLGHISTGEIIRDEIRRGTPAGKSVEEHIARGEFAPDKMVIGMIADFVDRNPNKIGHIFDGFPRTISQALVFDNMVEQRKQKVDVMLSLIVPEDELVARLINRGKDSGRADDSDESIIRHRIEIYEQRTAVLAEYYAKQGKYVAVNGLGTMDEVFDRLCAEINKLK